MNIQNMHRAPDSDLVLSCFSQCFWVSHLTHRLPRLIRHSVLIWFDMFLSSCQSQLLGFLSYLVFSVLTPNVVSFLGALFHAGFVLPTM